MQTLTPELAERFARIALGHVGREFPNKLDQVLAGPEDLASPRALHPIFYGSFDWHSAVHSHWLLARVLRRFPDAPSAGQIAAWLDAAFIEANVAGELAFLARPSAAGFERPYGWAWLLMLQAELEAHAMATGRARKANWAATMRPLAGAFEARFQAWLPKATYPTRVGTHGSSAFALALAHRYAPFAADHDFGRVLADAARRWFDRRRRRAAVRAERRRLPLADADGGRVPAPALAGGHVPHVVRRLPAAAGRGRAGGAVRARRGQ